MDFLRMECPFCRRLLFKYAPDLTGTLEKACPRQNCKRLLRLRFEPGRSPVVVLP